MKKQHRGSFQSEQASDSLAFLREPEPALVEVIVSYPSISQRTCIYPCLKMLERIWGILDVSRRTWPVLRRKLRNFYDQRSPPHRSCIFFLSSIFTTNTAFITPFISNRQDMASIVIRSAIIYHLATCNGERHYSLFKPIESEDRYGNNETELKIYTYILNTTTTHSPETQSPTPVRRVA